VIFHLGLLFAINRKQRLTLRSKSLKEFKMKRISVSDWFTLVTIGIVLGFAAPLQAGLSVTLTASLDSPAPLGSLVHFSSQVSGNDDAPVWYRFRWREVGSSFKVIVDYGPNSGLDWTTIDHEGSYQIEVSAQNKESVETSVAIANIDMTSRVVDSQTPVISPTANSLVFLYSAPPCANGGRMRVTVQSADGSTATTPYKACHTGMSMNFYLAGLRAQSHYSVVHTLDTGSKIATGPLASVATPPVSAQFANYDVLSGPADNTRPILLQSPLFSPIVATDLYGRIIWYYAGAITLTRAVGGGYFMGIVEAAGKDASQQVVRMFDLAGTTLAETNAARVSEQLVALGMHPISAFHHEAWRLPNGKYLVLASSERMLTDVQGPGDVDVIGDTILVLDENLQVDWAWDAFDHLDTHRLATLGETCTVSGGGCPPFHLAPVANDWLHGNALQLTPDGNILYSSRHQDWLIKINYDSGLGDGSVLWRLGKDGDFQVVSDDPLPWFSHQHDAQIQMSRNGLLLTVFDDGNVRWAADKTAHSRGQMLELDEQNLIAKLGLNADLGAFAYALGSAQMLPNGNFHFDVGWIQQDPMGGKNTSRSVEVDPSGNLVYVVEIDSPVYRSTRMRDLYTP
jgi:hypothetical protein